MDDFRKYATKHLGMNGMVLDDVIKSQAGYLNPYILEERQLNVTQLDVFSRLMMDRIIFLGTRFRHSCCIWTLLIRARIFLFISTLRAEVCTPDWAFTIRCSLSRVMWLRFVQVWRLLWQLYCWLPVKKASVLHCLTRVS